MLSWDHGAGEIRESCSTSGRSRPLRTSRMRTSNGPGPLGPTVYAMYRPSGEGAATPKLPALKRALAGPRSPSRTCNTPEGSTKK